MLEAVVGAIVNMAPAEKYLRLEVPTPMGHLIGTGGGARGISPTTGSCQFYGNAMISMVFYSY